MNKTVRDFRFVLLATATAVGFGVAIQGIDYITPLSIINTFIGASIGVGIGNMIDRNYNFYRNQVPISTNGLKEVKEENERLQKKQKDLKKELDQATKANAELAESAENERARHIEELKSTREELQRLQDRVDDSITEAESETPVEPKNGYVNRPNNNTRNN